MNSKISVVIVDDDVRVRTDFRQLLELERDIDVLGTANDGSTAVSLCTRLQPDVIVMDVRMPGVDGIDATRQLRSGNTDSCRVLVVTTFDIDDYVLGAIHAGANGFLLKDQAPEKLADAVRIVAAGDAIVSPRATARLLSELVGRAHASRHGTSSLTDREVGIVRMLATGLSNDEIASTAGVTRATVKSHVSSILTKLGLGSRIQIVVWAYQNNLVDR